MSDTIVEPTFRDIDCARECVRNPEWEAVAVIIARHLKRELDHDRLQSRALTEGFRNLAEELKAEVTTLRAQLAQGDVL